jgi:hypothetical protein
MAKKASSTRRKSPPTVESILAENEKHVRMGAGKNRKISAAAQTFWDSKYRPAIAARLATRGANWEKEKKHPLRIAKKLGKVAAALSNGRIIEKWAAEAATVAVKADPLCPGSGSGAWCEI